MVKWNWQKLRIVFPRKNEQLVFFLVIVRSFLVITRCFQKSIFNKPKLGARPLWPPVATALNLPSDKNFFFYCSKDLYLLFFFWIERNSLLFFCV